jgi:DNA repair exonuclease SbcCD ATPase subunit
MDSSTPVEIGVALTVRNVGGIESTTVELSPGVTLLEGRNATNRTSLLRSLMAALGSDNAALKGDADAGRVELNLAGETYTRTLRRENGTAALDGTPYLEDSAVADRFAFLLEDNAARRAVARGDDLRDIIMQPVDTESIEAEIDNTLQEKQRIGEELANLRTEADRLPELEQKQNAIENDLAEKRTELESIETEIESYEIDIEETRERETELEERLASLHETRNESETTKRRLDTEREQLEALRDERSELRRERESLPTSVEEISELGQRIGELQERKRTLDSLLDRLQNVIQFNQEMVSGSNSELREVFIPDDGSHPTDQLLAEETELLCWTCGSEVDQGQIEQTVEKFRSFREEKMTERKTVTSELDNLQEKRKEVEQRQQRREKIDHQLDRIADQIEQREQQIDALQQKQEQLTEQMADAEEKVEELEWGDHEEILELNKRANELQLEVQDLETDLEAVEGEITSVEADVEKISTLDDELQDVNQRLADLRTRVERIETDAIESFNHHISNILDVLGYDNLERIWIERRERTVRNGGQSVQQSTFDLHIVRNTSDGAAYEDTVEHLSESEREVTGLVFALAGYLTHEVYESVPFMVLDSLEAIDSERIDALVDYFREYTSYLVVALLPNDAQALPDTYSRVTSI